MPGPSWWVRTEPYWERPGKPFSAMGVRTYQRQYLVEVNTPTVTPEEVCFAPGVPLPYASYLSVDGALKDYFSLVSDLTAELKEEGDWGHWLVTVDWSTNTRFTSSGAPSQDGGQGGQQNHPEQEPPDINWDNETTMVAPQKDLDNKRFLNKAGVPFSPPVTVPVGNLVLNYSRNESNYNRDQADLYLYSVNDKPWKGYEKGTVWLTLYTGRAVYKGPLVYSRVNYRFRILDVLSRAAGKTWQTELLNQGLMELKAPDAKKAVNIIREGGRQIAHPVPLDNNGKEIDQKDLINGTKDVVYLKFRTLYEKDFDILQIIGV